MTHTTASLVILSGRASTPTAAVRCPRPLTIIARPPSVAATPRASPGQPAADDVTYCCGHQRQPWRGHRSVFTAGRSIYWCSTHVDLDLWPWPIYDSWITISCELIMTHTRAKIRVKGQLGSKIKCKQQTSKWTDRQTRSIAIAIPSARGSVKNNNYPVGIYAAVIESKPGGGFLYRLMACDVSTSLLFLPRHRAARVYTCTRLVVNYTRHSEYTNVDGGDDEMKRGLQWQSTAHRPWNVHELMQN